MRALRAAVAAVLVSTSARAANTSTLGNVEAYPTLTSIGVYADIAGDDSSVVRKRYGGDQDVSRR